MVEGLLVGVLLFSLQNQDRAQEVLKSQALAGLRQFYLQAGILGPEEQDRYFNYPFQLDYDLGVMRDREEQLQPDTPPFSFVLPPADLCKKNYWTARKFVNYLSKRIEENVEPAWEEDLHLILADAKWRLKVWDHLSDAAGAWADRDGKRLRLAKVRELVGREKFDSQDWPDPLPAAALNSTWDFKEEEIDL